MISTSNFIRVRGEEEPEVSIRHFDKGADEEFVLVTIAFGRIELCFNLDGAEALEKFRQALVEAFLNVKEV